MPCIEEGTQRRKVCSQQETDSYQKCDTWGEDRTKECSGFWGWLCVAFVWVVKTICVGWVWVSNVVCVAWSYIVEWVCLVWVAIVVFFTTLLGSRRVDVHVHLMTAHTIGVYVIVGLLEAILDIDRLLNGGPARGKRDLPQRTAGDLGIPTMV